MAEKAEESTIQELDIERIAEKKTAEKDLQAKLRDLQLARVEFEA